MRVRECPLPKAGIKRLSRWKPLPETLAATCCSITSHGLATSPGMSSVGTLRICGRSTPSLCQGKVAGDSSKGEIQQPVRIGSPSGSNGRGDRLSSWFIDAVTATSNLRSKRYSSGEKQPASAQTVFHPAAADGFHALGLTDPSAGRVDSTHPENATSEGVGTAICPTRYARCRAT